MRLCLFSAVIAVWNLKCNAFTLPQMAAGRSGGATSDFDFECVCLLFISMMIIVISLQLFIMCKYIEFDNQICDGFAILSRHKHTHVRSTFNCFAFNLNALLASSFGINAPNSYCIVDMSLFAFISLDKIGSCVHP